MLRRWDDSQRYLSENPHLVCEETANYLVIMCIDLEVEEVKTTECFVFFTQHFTFFPQGFYSAALLKQVQFSNIFSFSVETCFDGAGRSSDHRHAVHSRVVQKPQSGPTWLLSSIF